MKAPAERPVLVTGGAGFIGSALVRRLVLEREARVVTVDRLTYAANLDSLGAALEHPHHSLEVVDICDGPALRQVFERHRPGCVVHLAAESHVDRSIDGAAEFVRSNVVGTFTLLEEARRHRDGLPAGDREAFRFVHVSTDEVFGSLGEEGRFTEATPYRPSSPYSATKAGSDHLVRAWFHTHGLPTIVTNCSNNYGPCQFPEKLIPLALLRALEGESVPVYGTGANVRDWLFVDDHAEALCRVLEDGRPGRTYAIGGGAERRNLQVVREICALLDELRPVPGLRRESLIEMVADRPGHDHRYAIDSSRIREELGWRPRESFESGLRRTVEWYLANPGWVRRVLSGEYRLERLGAGGVG